MAAIIVGAATLCGGATMSLRAQTQPQTTLAPAPAPAATAPVATAGTPEKQALVRSWFSAAATLDLPTIIALSDPATSEKFKLVLERVPDLAKTRASADFKTLEKKILELLPQVLTLGEPVPEGDSEAYIPVTLDEAKVPQWVELKELTSLYINDWVAAQTAKRPPASLEELTKKAKEDPSFAGAVKQNSATLLSQSKLVPRAFIVQDHGVWKVNLTRLEKESRDAAAAAKK